ncbi:molybdopterin biosynthesis enzyme [Sphingomonas fennica]|uniref:Molybdopterin biosynthesis enzyme n=1 Tax=Edaphosphingomonas fennica TaxID=114404 RepID=A0A2T4HYL7_9SPHN|nr:molybdopterin biosynthesis enzyme [Sphingomonas fennica]PTD21194.1 molybdopterin biosynthesis enzyme [Sphingomonas fennica]
MRFGPVPTGEALGALLGHGRMIGGRRLPKGRSLTPDDIALAEREGVTELVVAQLDPGDVGEDEAAVAIAAALAGAGVEASVPRHGRVDLIALHDGLFHCDGAAIDAVNLVTEAIGLGTLHPCRPVRAGDAVATMKIIPYAIGGQALAAAIAAARRADIGVRPFALPATALIQTRLPGQPDKMFAGTAVATRQRLARLGAALAAEHICNHDEAALARRLGEQDEAIVLVAGASATVDRRDVIPAAIVAAGGEVERLGMPVEPGNLLCLGRIGGRIVIGLPGCARSPRRNGIDLVLERIAVGLPVDGGVIARMGVGGLIADQIRRDGPYGQEAWEPED